MMSVNSDSKLFICSDCFSISFSSLETLSVLGEVGALFWEDPCGYLVYFECLVPLGHRRLRDWCVW